MEGFGGRLRRIRMAVGWTPDYFARGLDLEPSLYARLESGELVPEESMVADLAGRLPEKYRAWLVPPTIPEVRLTRRISVLLDEDDFARLCALARADRRRPQDQAGVLLSELLRAGMGEQ